MAERKIITLDGQRFGRLAVLQEGPRPKFGRAWTCLCVCGEIRHVGQGALIKGTSRSCGYLRNEMAGNRRRTHGQAGKTITRAFQAWRSMKARINNPNVKNFDRYGGRGISICEEFKTFAGFYAVMGDCPPDLTLDRIDNDGNYEVGNCRWATPTEQARNRRNGILITMDGKTQTLAAWTEELSLPYGTIWQRLKAGWTPEKALTFKKEVH